MTSIFTNLPALLDFEEGNLNDYDSTEVSGSGSNAVTTSPVWAGTYAHKAAITTGIDSDYARGYKSITWPAGDIGYAHWWVQITAVGTQNSYCVEMCGFYNSTSAHLSMRLNPSTGLVQLYCLDSTGVQPTALTHTFLVGQWYEIEMKLDRTTSNAECQWWINGVSIGTWRGSGKNSSSPNRLTLQVLAGSALAGAYATIVFDNASAEDARIGTDASDYVHFVKMDSTQRSSTSVTATEVVLYTINWINLTAAGFAASDEVAIIVGVKVGNSGSNNNTYFQVGFGTTYAGRTDQADSLIRQEAPAAGGYAQHLWLDKRTLVTSENIYFSLWVTGGTGVANELFVIILKLGGTGGLGSSDYGYDEQTHVGAAPSAYDTSGASFSTPASGDWLLLAFTHWLINSTSADALMAISADGTDYAEILSEGEDTDDQYCLSTPAYRASLGASKTCRTRYRTDDGTSHNCDYTKILGIRLDVFADHWGAHTTSTITHSVVDTYQEFAGGSYVKTTTGKLIALALPIHTFTDAAKTPYGRVQIGGYDFDVPSRNRVGAKDNGAAAQRGPFIFGYDSAAPQTLDIDFDCAEDADISPTYDCTEQIAVVFSLSISGEALTASLADTVGITDVISKSIGRRKTLSDSVGITDVIIEIISYRRTNTDTVGVTDTLSKVGTFIKNLSDTVGITDLLLTVVGVIILLADAIGITDLISIVKGFRRSLTNTVGITDTIAKVGQFKKTVQNNVGITDLLSVARTLIKALSDIVGITDTLTKIGTYKRAIADSIGITDIVARALVIFAALADSIGITDIISNARAIRKALSEAVGITDVIAIARGIMVSIADSLGITDILTTARDLAISIADAVGITDVIAAIKLAAQIFVALYESIGITDTVSWARQLRRTVINAVGITDVLTKIGTFKKTLTSTVGITDILSKAAGFFISLADTVGITDTVNGILKLVVSLADSVGITDTISRVIAFRRSLQNGITITDILSTARNLVKLISDSIGITDTLITARNIIIAIANTVGITDAIQAIKTTGKIFVALADSVGITDAISRVISFRRTKTDSVNITDNLSKVGTYIKNLTDNVTISDNLFKAINFKRQVLDTVQISDIISSVIKIVAYISNTIGVTDVLTRVASFRRTLQENIGISAFFSKVGTFKRAVQDTINIIDIIAAYRKYYVLITDAIGILDTIAATVVSLAQAYRSTVTDIGNKTISLIRAGLVKLRTKGNKTSVDDW